MSARDANREAQDALERAVLAPLLDGRDQTLWAKCAQHITPDVFEHRDHALVWVACCAVAASGGRVDQVSVSQRLSAMPFAAALAAIKPEAAKHQLERAVSEAGVSFEDSALAAMGGFTALDPIAQAFAPTASTESAAILLGTRYRARVLRQSLEALVKDLSRPSDQAGLSAVIERVMAATSAASDMNLGHKTIGDALEASLAAHDRAQAKGSTDSARWGLGPLDLLHLLEPGRLAVLAAPRSCGKTSLALQAAEATGREYGANSVGFVSLEMTSTELANILAGREAGVPVQFIERGGLTLTQRERMEAIKREWKERAPVLVKDGAFALSVQAVSAWARVLRMMHGTDLKLLIVDHLHVLAPSSPRQNEYQKLSEATAALKALAMELGVPVLLLAQMNRAGTRQDRDRNGGIEAAPPRPQLADLRGSGTIEQDADAVVFLWAHQGIRASSAPVQVLVEKNRHGPLAEIDTQWLRSQGQRFVVGAAVEPSQEVREELARRRDRAGSGPRDSEDLFQ